MAFILGEKQEGSVKLTAVLYRMLRSRMMELYLRSTYAIMAQYLII
jgi:hypothetical protein